MTMFSRFGMLTLAGFCALWLGLSSTARANDQRFDLNSAYAPTDPYGILTIETSRLYKTFRFGTGLHFRYAYRPLVLMEAGKGVSKDLVSHRLNMDLYFSATLCPYYEVGFDLPFVLAQEGGGLRDPIQGAALSDLRFHNKFKALDRERYPVGLALATTLVLPTGDEGSYAGNLGVGAEFKLVIDAELGPFIVAGNLGYRIRDEVHVYNRRGYRQQIDDELLFGVGGQYNTPVENLSVQAEFRTSTLAESPFNQPFNTPLSLAAGLRYQGPYDLIFGGGVEIGLWRGYGTSPVAIFAQIGWTWDKPDQDKDGVPDESDACLTDPEDEDNFQDEDGCPDPDNDLDGIKDRDDACPNDPEDKDDYREEDGCPDPDNDADGIPDTADKCPNAAEDVDQDRDEDGCPDTDADQDGFEDIDDGCPFAAEDKDQFEDQDGCPDPDNDKDAVPDVADRCPNEPEDKDSFQDEDGCPDPDNDQDGIPDSSDKCPNDAEDKDQFEDQDGCPDLDNDKDGLPDSADKCPNEAEDKDSFEDADGCPDLDNDQDGTPDAADRCPGELEDRDGFDDGDGCPDLDNDEDGVPDLKDRCPDDPKKGAKDGCPAKPSMWINRKETQTELTLVIRFEPNSSVLDSTAFARLDRLARQAKEAGGSVKVLSEGFAPGGGRPSQDLSLARAQAVGTYLSGRGIDPKAVEAKGQGAARLKGPAPVQPDSVEVTITLPAPKPTPDTAAAPAKETAPKTEGKPKPAEVKPLPKPQPKPPTPPPAKPGAADDEEPALVIPRAKP